MTDRRIDHRAAAELLLSYADEWADEWAAQAGELSPEASELSCLAYATVHTLLAIHDTLAAADRYAANEAKQREAAEPDISPLDPSMAECSRCGQVYPGTPEALLAHHGECTGEDEPEMSEAAEWLSRGGADPLDENDHRDRLDRHGDIWQRVHEGCWTEPDYPPVCHGPAVCLPLAALPGPLTFTPDADGAPSVTSPVADGPADDAVDGEEGERRYLNAQTGRERTRLTAQLRQVISSVQDSGDLAELDALADEWEAGTDG